MQGAPQPAAVLHEEWPVEAVEHANLGDAGIGGVVPGQGDGDIAGHELLQPEHDEGRQQDHRHDLHKAPADQPETVARQHVSPDRTQ